MRDENWTLYLVRFSYKLTRKHAITLWLHMLALLLDATRWKLNFRHGYFTSTHAVSFQIFLHLVYIIENTISLNPFQLTKWALFYMKRNSSTVSEYYDNTFAPIGFPMTKTKHLDPVFLPLIFFGENKCVCLKATYRYLMTKKQDCHLRILVASFWKRVTCKPL